jgi:methyltransferase-like protein/SAM-dependent methyltransferase
MPDPPPATPYDEVPYESNPFTKTHPDRLAAIATLWGMTPAPVERCRVLELGCASGGNLIPMALGLPQSSFIGIDLSQRQIADGQKTVDALGLKNIELRHASILDVDAGFGLFDYIICHGVYSWVPPEVQEKILRVCAENLAPAGVAFVSYNTYPGWHMRGMIREMMSYHAKNFPDPQTQVRQARALLDFLAKSVPAKDSPYSMMLARELDSLRKQRDWYLFHEHLERFNEPIYFHQFAERAAAKKLRYLGDADLSTMTVHSFPPEVQNTLQTLAASRVHGEQYMDFLHNRTFRQTLLCHENVALDSRIRPERIMRLHLASCGKLAGPEPEIRGDAPMQFRGRGDTTATTSDPLMKAAMVHLAALWPRSAPFDELVRAARSRLGKDAGADFEPDRQALATQLLNWYIMLPLIELHAHAPAFVLEPGERPIASPLARLQARRGSATVTNLRHETVTLADAERELLALLDGTRDRAALADALVDLISRGVFAATRKDQPITDPAELRRVMKNAPDQIVQRLAGSALLISGNRGALERPLSPADRGC